MISLIVNHREALHRLCEQFRVRRLELFGSAANGRDFRAEASDLDFLVEFLPLQPGEFADAYFGLLEALQQLFGRSVDLVMVGAIKNRYFLEAVNESRTLLYAA